MDQKHIEILDKYFKEIIPDKTGNFPFYTSVAEEFSLVKRGAVIRVVPQPNVLELSGKDVSDFLQRISTNDVAPLKENNKIGTIFTNEKGRIIDHTTLLRLFNRYVLIGNPDREKRLFNWLNKYLIMEDVSISDVSENYSLIEVFGVQAESYLTLIFGKAIEVLNDSNLLHVNVDGFRLHLYSRVFKGGLKKYFLLTGEDIAADFLDYLLRNRSLFNISMMGEKAWELLRIEHGIPAMPNELNDSVNPYEADIIEDVSFKKGCFIGQEVIARLDTYDKVQRVLKRFVVKGDMKKNGEMKIEDNSGIEAGIVTSLVNSELTESYKGLALVRKKFLNGNNEFTIYVPGVGRIPLELKN